MGTTPNLVARKIIIETLFIIFHYMNQVYFILSSAFEECGTKV